MSHRHAIKQSVATDDSDTAVQGSPPLDPELLIEHLKLIDGYVTRMSGNQFLIKAWTVPLVIAVAAVARVQGDPALLIVTAVAVAPLAVLDAFYLALERAYQDLYRRAARGDSMAPWTLEIEPVGLRAVGRATRSASILLFFPAVALAVVALAVASAGT